MSLPPLPLDVLIHILDQLPSYRNTDSSIDVLVNFSQVNSLFREASSLSTIWESHYRTRYSHCELEAEAQRKEQTHNDWRVMYYNRRSLDKAAILLLNEMVHNRSTRYELAKTLSRYGFDVWDALELESKHLLPNFLREDTGDLQTGASPSSLTLTFWAKSMMQAISREYAFRLWDRVRLSESNFSQYVESYSAVSCFLGQSPYDVGNTSQPCQIILFSYLVGIYP